MDGANDPTFDMIESGYVGEALSTSSRDLVRRYPQESERGEQLFYATRRACVVY